MHYFLKCSSVAKKKQHIAQVELATQISYVNARTCIILVIYLLLTHGHAHSQLIRCYLSSHPQHLLQPTASNKRHLIYKSLYQTQLYAIILSVFKNNSSGTGTYYISPSCVSDGFVEPTPKQEQKINTDNQLCICSHSDRIEGGKASEEECYDM